MRLGNIFFNLKITDILYTYVLVKLRQKLNLKNKDFSFCIELPIKASRQNMKLSSITLMRGKNCWS